MYLEISPRQTGKTTRLLHAVRVSLEGDNKSIIFCHNQCTILWLKKKFLAEYSDARYFLDRIKFAVANTVQLNVEMWGKDYKNYNLFFDEFDHFDSKFWDTGHKIFGNFPALRNGYFCTSPAFIRQLKDITNPESKDFLCQALQFNGFNYVSVNPINPHRDLYKDTATIDILTREQYLSEVLGKFV